MGRASGASWVWLQFWRLPAWHVPGALARSRRPDPGLRFSRLLGTAGPAFTITDARPTRWAWLAVTDEAAPPPAQPPWASPATASCRFALAPTATRGSWSGHRFLPAAPDRQPPDPQPPGPVAVLTRARLRPRTAPAFWRAVPAIAGQLGAAPGLHFSCGIADVPLLCTGTFSVWADAASANAFSTAGAHAGAVRARRENRWYLEESFTWLHVLEVTGDPAAVGLLPPDPVR